jgi:hypothetical protein
MTFMARTVDTYRGTRLWSNKLTEEQVCEIRRRYVAGGVGTRRLATEYGVCQSNIRAIVTGKIWKHLLPGDSLSAVGGV